MDDEKNVAAQGQSEGKPVGGDLTIEDLIRQDEEREQAENAETDGSDDPDAEGEAEEAQPEASETLEERLAKAEAKANSLEKRIHKQSGKSAELRREAARYRSELENYQRSQLGGQPQQPQHDPDYYIRLGEAQGIERLNALRWVEAGEEAYPDFGDRSQIVADILPDANAHHFRKAISSVKGGHRVVAYLSENTDEAERILNLDPYGMAAELGVIAERSSRPRALPRSSSAPSPIKPISRASGSAIEETDPNKMSMEQWIKWDRKNSVQR